MSRAAISPGVYSCSSWSISATTCGLVPPAPEDFYDVINERYERGAVIITSNRAFSEWPDLFQSPLLASAALDRLAHHAHQLTITGESFRAKGRRRSTEKEKGGSRI